MNTSERSTLDTQVAPGVYRCDDQKIRWFYEMSMWRNPTIFFTVWKILVGVACGLALFMFFLELGNGFTRAGGLFLKFAGYGVGGATALLLVGYMLVASLYGGRYCVQFEMDEKGVLHKQMPRQFKRARGLAFTGAVVGAALGNPTLMGASALASARSSSYSEFQKVKRIIVRRRRNVIHIHSSLTRNQVYAGGEQFGFVLQYIVTHCPGARMKQ